MIRNQNANWDGHRRLPERHLRVDNLLLPEVPALLEVQIFEVIGPVVACTSRCPEMSRVSKQLAVQRVQLVNESVLVKETSLWSCCMLHSVCMSLCMFPRTLVFAVGFLQESTTPYETIGFLCFHHFLFHFPSHILHILHACEMKSSCTSSRTGCAHFHWVTGKCNKNYRTIEKHGLDRLDRLWQLQAWYMVS